MAVIGLACGLIAWRAQALPERARRIIGQVIAAALLGYAIAFYAITVRQSGFRASDGLPLNVCDVVLFAALAGLLFRSPIGFELAYFWGLAGTLQGLITPDLRSGFPTFRYFHFFWGHGAIILALVWMLSAEGLRPRVGGVKRAFLALNAYVLVMGAADWMFGWNYGYLHHRPGHHSLLSVLGPFPWYILWCDLIALGLFLLLDLPWRAGRRATPTSSVG